MLYNNLIKAALGVALSVVLTSTGFPIGKAPIPVKNTFTFKSFKSSARINLPLVRCVGKSCGGATMPAPPADQIK